MNSLCEGALSVLEQVYREESGVFPFTSTVDGAGYRSVYDHPRTLLSTINCLLGLQEAARHAAGHPFVARADEMTTTFLRRHEHEVVAPADIGLLLLLLGEADGGAELDRLGPTLARARAIIGDEARFRRLNAQEVTWLLWGTVAACRRGVAEAEPTAHRLFSGLVAHFVKPGEVLARHTLRGGRGPFVSFGACVYFLRAMHSYGSRYSSAAALAMFEQGLAALLSAQGPDGEWPWMVSCADGRPLDFYPVFSVHQLSMAMLFLFPAREDGRAGIADVIDRSTAWAAGKNQLGRPMVQHDPFFIYRSMERTARLARVERFVRARRMLLTSQPAELAANDRLVLNTESRSYELGWLLYAWSHSDGIPGFD